MSFISAWIIKNPLSSILIVVVLLLSGVANYFRVSNNDTNKMYLADEKTIADKESAIKYLKLSNDGLFLDLQVQNKALDKLKIDAKQADIDHTIYVNKLKTTFNVERQKLLKRPIQYKVDCNNSLSVLQADDALTTVHFLFGDKK